jgi:hypothetical protein
MHAYYWIWTGGSPVDKTVQKQSDAVNTADSSVIKPEYK